MENKLIIATADKKQAIEYLQTVYPDKRIKRWKLRKFLDLLGQDIIRLQNPSIYGVRIAVIPGKHYSAEKHGQLKDKAIAELYNHLGVKPE